MRNEQSLRKLAAMDRIYLIIVCASIVLLTIAVGSAWQAGNVENGARSALLRIVRADPLGNAKLFDGEAGDLLWLVFACPVDFDDLARDDIANRIVFAINQPQRSQGERIGPVSFRIGQLWGAVIAFQRISEGGLRAPTPKYSCFACAQL